MQNTSILIQANRADWKLIIKVYGPNGAHYARKMLTSRVAEVARELRERGITEHTSVHRRHLVNICAQ